MYRDRRIAVNISAYNEEKLIADTISRVPDWVDLIVVVDDCSTDLTVEIVSDISSRSDRGRIMLIPRRENGGFGAVTVAGYHYIMGQWVHYVANLNGDGQMDVDNLQNMLDILIDDHSLDIIKGDRLSHPDAKQRMPFVRRLGGKILSKLTSYVTGTYISDSQHTYHVIKMDSLKRLRLNRLYRRFGYPNDFLIECAKQGFKIRNYPVKPIYDNGAVSLLKPWKVAPRILWILIKGFVQIRAIRLARKLDIFCNENPAY